jgi:anaerobic ribonucleoside-triphosphate reductase activating protein
MLRPAYIRGLTLLGGEPFEPQNQGAVVELLRQIKKELPEKSIWAFSGYLFDKDILSGRLGDWETTKEYISYLDVLVDGPFIQSLRNADLLFRGSSNQRLIDVQKSLRSGEVVEWRRG